MQVHDIDSEREQEGLFTVCLMAAFADGMKSDLERAEIQRITETLKTEGLPLAKMYQEVIHNRIAPGQIAQAISTSTGRMLAYELAYCVCEADGAVNPQEKTFLESLRREFKLNSNEASILEAETVAVAQAPVTDAIRGAAPPVIPGPGPDQTELDGMILNYSILAGALELLPDTLATMAIIPIQMRMVYRVGKQFGFELDRGHIKDFLGTVGVGMTSQMVEGFARKVASKFVGRLAGGFGRRVAGQLTSSGLSFTSTYAIGHVAKRYYAAGRRLSPADLKSLFHQLTGDATALQTRYLPQIQQKAGAINLRELVPLIRNSP